MAKTKEEIRSSENPRALRVSCYRLYGKCDYCGNAQSRCDRGSYILPRQDAYKNHRRNFGARLVKAAQLA